MSSVKDDFDGLYVPLAKPEDKGDAAANGHSQKRKTVQIVEPTTVRSKPTRLFPGRIIFVWPVYAHADDRDCLALQIEDAELVRALRRSILDIYRSIAQDCKTLPLLEHDTQRAQHLQIVHHSRPSLRLVTVTRGLRQLHEYRPRRPATTVLMNDSDDNFQFELHPAVFQTDEMQRQFRSTIQSYHMPFSMPRALRRSDLARIYKDRYEIWLVTFKADGQRMQWSMRTHGYKFLSIWMDRLGKCCNIVSIIGFPELFQGTVWDGEVCTLDTAGRETAYLIFDCMAGNGRSVSHLPLHVRMQVARATVEEWERLQPSDRVKPKRPPMDPYLYCAEHWVTEHLVVRVKRRYFLWDLAFLLEAMEELDVLSDGLILDANEQPVQERGTEWTLRFKFVPTGDIQFRLEYRTNTRSDGAWFSIWVYDTDERAWLSWVRHGHVWMSEERLLRLKLTDFIQLHMAIVEMRRIRRPAGIATWAPSLLRKDLQNPHRVDHAKWMWVPVKVRWDKERPNSLQTHKTTEQSCDENLKLSELVTNSYLVTTRHLLNDGYVPLPIYNGPGESKSTPVNTTQITDPMKLFEQPPCLAWRLLKARDDLAQTWEDDDRSLNEIWKTPIRVPLLRPDEVLPDPTLAGPHSLKTLRQEHQKLCASWSLEHQVYMMTRPAS